MYRVARSFTTAAVTCCPKTTSSARLAAHSLRGAAAAAAVRPLPAAAQAAAVVGGGAHSRRMIHVRVPLPYNIEDGMGEFLSPEALKVIGVDYQQGLLDRLNEQIKGTKLQNASVAQIVISTAARESQTLAFNYASLALNNSFFLHHLKPPTAKSPNHEAALTDRRLNADRTQMTLGGVIAAQLGSLQDLKTYVTAAATGMLSSSGFVWLVTDNLGRLGVIATYGAGTLLVNDRRQTFSPDSNTELGGVYVPAKHPTPTSTQPMSPAPGRAPPPLRTDPPPGARALSTTAYTHAPGVGDGPSRPASVWSDPPYATTYAGTGTGVGNGNTDGSTTALDSLGQTLYPLFCVSVHEHAWMAAGYGVWGKETYLDRFWTCLDWAAVRDAYVWYTRFTRPKY